MASSTTTSSTSTTSACPSTPASGSTPSAATTPTVDAISDAIEPRPKTDGYTSTFGGGDQRTPGRSAKALVFAQTAGARTRRLRRREPGDSLEGVVASGAPIAGRIQDVSNDFGDCQRDRPVLRRARPRRGRLGQADAATTSCSSSSAPPATSASSFADEAAARPDAALTAQRGSAPDTDVTALACSTCSPAGAPTRTWRTRLDQADDVAARRAAGRRLLRRRPDHRGAEHQQHRPRRLRARPHGDTRCRRGPRRGSAASRPRRSRAARPWDADDLGAIAYDAGGPEARQARRHHDARPGPVAPCDRPGASGAPVGADPHSDQRPCSDPAGFGQAGGTTRRVAVTGRAGRRRVREPGRTGARRANAAGTPRQSSRSRPARPPGPCRVRRGHQRHRAVDVLGRLRLPVTAQG